ncbi:MAG: DNA protecting protein DprA [Desulfobulbaceae bacterium A2]|nr:MAG: DNA protecting protein DprA [Desulfobulbaceae bacterium A2]
MATPSVRDWLALSCIAGLGPVRALRLARSLGGATAALSALGREATLLPEFRLRQADEARRWADGELARAAAGGMTFVCWDDEGYPPLLREIHDPPLVLWLRGDAACLARPAVAVVGSRAASDYGRRVARELGRELVRRGLVVVSGLALGIDAEAHRGALAAGGVTVGVLGCGLDVVYPPIHGSLYQELAISGAVLSEYPPDTSPEPFRFPARNRIVSGLSLGTVVVEAGQRSGALITARLALEQGREVFAVPGRIDSHKSSGTHRLLQDGAKLVQSVDDICEEIGWRTQASAPRTEAVPAPAASAVGDEEQRLLDILADRACEVDELVRTSGLDAATVGGALLRLELAGRIRQVGRGYERVG